MGEVKIPFSAADLEQVLATDPVNRATIARDVIQTLQGRMVQFASVRARAVKELQEKVGATEAARLLGVSRGQVYALTNEDGDRPQHHPFPQQLAIGQWIAVCNECRGGFVGLGEGVPSREAAEQLCNDHRGVFNGRPRTLAEAERAALKGAGIIAPDVDGMRELEPRDVDPRWLATEAVERQRVLDRLEGLN